MNRPISVVVPARNADSTIGATLGRLAEECEPGDEVIVIDDGSTDATAAIAGRQGALVISSPTPCCVGAARNRGWELAGNETVVFLDADALLEPGWRAGLARAVEEFPASVIGCARTLTGRSRWSWVAQLQVGTVWLARGAPRKVKALPSFCLAVPSRLPVRWDESFGGEDGLFAADVLKAGFDLVFDPRFQATHVEYRDTFEQLRAWQRRFAYGMARCGAVQREGLHKRLLSRLPLHYFALARLPAMYLRLREHDELRRRFLSLLPWMAIAEWTLGWSALRYCIRRPPLRSQLPAASAAS